MNRPTPVYAVVLAAGCSRRFGSDKRFANLESGAGLLEASVAALGTAPDETFVVIRPEDRKTGRFTDTRLRYLVSKRAADGMAYSLAGAVRQLPPACHVMVALGDMPHIQNQTVDALVRHFRQSARSAPIVFPLFTPEDKRTAPRRGHPVIFHRHYREELEALVGDKGAGGILAAHPDAHDPLEVNDRGVIDDIDRPSDL